MHPGKGVDISIVTLAKPINAHFALRCMRHTPPRRASKTSREANTRIDLVLRVLLEVLLSRNPSQRHCTAPICIAEVGLRDFQSRHLRYLFNYTERARGGGRFYLAARIISHFTPKIQLSFDQGAE